MKCYERKVAWSHGTYSFHTPQQPTKTVTFINVFVNFVHVFVCGEEFMGFFNYPKGTQYIKRNEKAESRPNYCL